jgi:uncharacterized membrane protein (UPF0127 family)
MKALQARRFRHLWRVFVLGREVPVADRAAARLLGLALLSRERAGPGLLIPRCRGVHTFGMRFELDLYFLGTRGEVVDRRLAVAPNRFAFCRHSAAVLELPSQDRLEGGEGERAPT